jgi:hypothetical protein
VLVDKLEIGLIVHEEFEKCPNPKWGIQNHIKAWDHRQYYAGGPVLTV